MSFNSFTDEDSFICDNDKFERQFIGRLRTDRETIQAKTYKNWINSVLLKARTSIDDIYVDLCNGQKLLLLLELITGEKIAEPNKGASVLHKIENVSRCLKFIKSKNVYLESIGPEDIVNGNKRLILGLIWTIILRFQLSQHLDFAQFDLKSIKDSLLLWCQSKTGQSTKCNVRDLKRSWSNGWAFVELIRSFRPDLIPDPESMRQMTSTEVLNRAFELANQHLMIPNILDAEDVANSPDENSILTYISYFYNLYCKTKSTETGTKRIRYILTQVSEVQNTQSSYEQQATELTQWIREKCAHFERDIDINEAHQLMSQFNDYFFSERPARLKARNDCESLYMDIVNQHKKMGMRPFCPKSGLTVKDLEKAWLHLEDVETSRLSKLKAQMAKYEQLTRVSDTFDQKCIKLENYISEKMGLLNQIFRGEHCTDLNRLEVHLKQSELICCDIVSSSAKFDSIFKLADQLIEHRFKNHEFAAMCRRHLKAKLQKLTDMAAHNHRTIESTAKVISYMRQLDCLKAELNQLQTGIASLPLNRTNSVQNVFVNLEKLKQSETELRLLERQFLVVQSRICLLTDNNNHHSRAILLEPSVAQSQLNSVRALIDQCRDSLDRQLTNNQLNLDFNEFREEIEFLQMFFHERQILCQSSAEQCLDSTSILFAQRRHNITKLEVKTVEKQFYATCQKGYRLMARCDFYSPLVGEYIDQVKQQLRRTMHLVNERTYLINDSVSLLRLCEQLGQLDLPLLANEDVGQVQQAVYSLLREPEEMARFELAELDDLLEKISRLSINFEHMASGNEPAGQATATTKSAHLVRLKQYSRQQCLESARHAFLLLQIDQPLHFLRETHRRLLRVVTDNYRAAQQLLTATAYDTDSASLRRLLLEQNGAAEVASNADRDDSQLLTSAGTSRSLEETEQMVDLFLSTDNLPQFLGSLHDRQAMFQSDVNSMTELMAFVRNTMQLLRVTQTITRTFVQVENDRVARSRRRHQEDEEEETVTAARTAAPIVRPPVDQLNTNDTNPPPTRPTSADYVSRLNPDAFKFKVVTYKLQNDLNFIGGYLGGNVADDSAAALKFKLNFSSDLLRKDMQQLRLLLQQTAQHSGDADNLELRQEVEKTSALLDSVVAYGALMEEKVQTLQHLEAVEDFAEVMADNVKQMESILTSGDRTTVAKSANQLRSMTVTMESHYQQLINETSMTSSSTSAVVDQENVKSYQNRVVNLKNRLAQFQSLLTQKSEQCRQRLGQMASSVVHSLPAAPSSTSPSSDLPPKMPLTIHESTRRTINNTAESKSARRLSKDKNNNWAHDDLETVLRNAEMVLFEIETGDGVSQGRFDETMASCERALVHQAVVGNATLQQRLTNAKTRLTQAWAIRAQLSELEQFIERARVFIATCSSQMKDLQSAQTLDRQQIASHKQKHVQLHLDYRTIYEQFHSTKSAEIGSRLVQLQNALNKYEEMIKEAEVMCDVMAQLADIAARFEQMINSPVGNCAQAESLLKELDAAMQTSNRSSLSQHRRSVVTKRVMHLKKQCIEAQMKVQLGTLNTTMHRLRDADQLSLFSTLKNQIESLLRISESLDLERSVDALDELLLNWSLISDKVDRVVELIERQSNWQTQAVTTESSAVSQVLSESTSSEYHQTVVASKETIEQSSQSHFTSIVLADAVSTSTEERRTLSTASQISPLITENPENQTKPQLNLPLNDLNSTKSSTDPEPIGTGNDNDNDNETNATEKAAPPAEQTPDVELMPEFDGKTSARMGNRSSLESALSADYLLSVKDFGSIQASSEENFAYNLTESSQSLYYSESDSGHCELAYNINSPESRSEHNTGACTMCQQSEEAEATKPSDQTPPAAIGTSRQTISSSFNSLAMNVTDYLESSDELRESESEHLEENDQLVEEFKPTVEQQIALSCRSAENRISQVWSQIETSFERITEIMNRGNYSLELKALLNEVSIAIERRRQQAEHDDQILELDDSTTMSTETARLILSRIEHLHEVLSQSESKMKHLADNELKCLAELSSKIEPTDEFTVKTDESCDLDTDRAAPLAGQEDSWLPPAEDSADAEAARNYRLAKSQPIDFTSADIASLSGDENDLSLCSHTDSELDGGHLRLDETVDQELLDGLEEKVGGIKSELEDIAARIAKHSDAKRLSFEECGVDGRFEFEVTLGKIEPRIEVDTALDADEYSPSPISVIAGAQNLAVDDLRTDSAAEKLADIGTDANTTSGGGQSNSGGDKQSNEAENGFAAGDEKITSVVDAENMGNEDDDQMADIEAAQQSNTAIDDTTSVLCSTPQDEMPLTVPSAEAEVGESTTPEPSSEKKKRKRKNKKKKGAKGETVADNNANTGQTLAPGELATKSDTQVDDLPELSSSSLAMSGEVRHESAVVESSTEFKSEMAVDSETELATLKLESDATRAGDLVTVTVPQVSDADNEQQPEGHSTFFKVTESTASHSEFAQMTKTSLYVGNASMSVSETQLSRLGELSTFDAVQQQAHSEGAKSHSLNSQLNMQTAEFADSSSSRSIPTLSIEGQVMVEEEFDEESLVVILDEKSSQVYSSMENVDLEMAEKNADTKRSSEISCQTDALGERQITAATETDAALCTHSTCATQTNANDKQSIGVGTETIETQVCEENIKTASQVDTSNSSDLNENVVESSPANESPMNDLSSDTEQPIAAAVHNSLDYKVETSELNEVVQTAAETSSGVNLEAISLVGQHIEREITTHNFLATKYTDNNSAVVNESTSTFEWSTTSNSTFSATEHQSCESSELSSTFESEQDQHFNAEQLDSLESKVDQIASQMDAIAEKLVEHVVNSQSQLAEEQSETEEKESPSAGETVESKIETASTDQTVAEEFGESTESTSQQVITIDDESGIGSNEQSDIKVVEECELLESVDTSVSTKTTETTELQAKAKTDDRHEANTSEMTSTVPVDIEQLDEANQSTNSKSSQSSSELKSIDDESISTSGLIINQQNNASEPLNDAEQSNEVAEIVGVIETEQDSMPNEVVTTLARELIANVISESIELLEKQKQSRAVVQTVDDAVENEIQMPSSECESVQVELPSIEITAAADESTESNEMLHSGDIEDGRVSSASSLLDLTSDEHTDDRTSDESHSSSESSKKKRKHRKKKKRKRRKKKAGKGVTQPVLPIETATESVTVVTPEFGALSERQMPVLENIDDASESVVDTETVECTASSINAVDSEITEHTFDLPGENQTEQLEARNDEQSADGSAAVDIESAVQSTPGDELQFVTEELSDNDRVTTNTDTAESDITVATEIVTPNEIGDVPGIQADAIQPTSDLPEKPIDSEQSAIGNETSGDLTSNSCGSDIQLNESVASTAEPMTAYSPSEHSKTADEMGQGSVQDNSAVSVEGSDVTEQCNVNLKATCDDLCAADNQFPISEPPNVEENIDQNLKPASDDLPNETIAQLGDSVSGVSEAIADELCSTDALMSETVPEINQLSKGTEAQEMVEDEVKLPSIAIDEPASALGSAQDDDLSTVPSGEAEQQNAELENENVSQIAGQSDTQTESLAESSPQKTTGEKKKRKRKNKKKVGKFEADADMATTNQTAPTTESTSEGNVAVPSQPDDLQTPISTLEFSKVPEQHSDTLNDNLSESNNDTDKLPFNSEPIAANSEIAIDLEPNEDVKSGEMTIVAPASIEESQNDDLIAQTELNQQDSDDAIQLVSQNDQQNSDIQSDAPITFDSAELEQISAPNSEATIETVQSEVNEQCPVNIDSTSDHSTENQTLITECQLPIAEEYIIGQQLKSTPENLSDETVAQAGDIVPSDATASQNAQLDELATSPEENAVMKTPECYESPELADNEPILSGTAFDDATDVTGSTVEIDLPVVVTFEESDQPVDASDGGKISQITSQLDDSSEEMLHSESQTPDKLAEKKKKRKRQKRKKAGKNESIAVQLEQSDDVLEELAVSRDSEVPCESASDSAESQLDKLPDEKSNSEPIAVISDEIAASLEPGDDANADELVNVTAANSRENHNDNPVVDQMNSDKHAIDTTEFELMSPSNDESTTETVEGNQLEENSSIEWKCSAKDQSTGSQTATTEFQSTDEKIDSQLETMADVLLNEPVYPIGESDKNLCSHQLDDDATSDFASPTAVLQENGTSDDATVQIDNEPQQLNQSETQSPSTTELLVTENTVLSPTLLPVDLNRDITTTVASSEELLQENAVSDKATEQAGSELEQFNQAETESLSETVEPFGNDDSPTLLPDELSAVTTAAASSGELSTEQPPVLIVSEDQTEQVNVQVDEPINQKAEESKKRKRTELQIPECLFLREKKKKRRHRRKHKGSKSPAYSDDEASLQLTADEMEAECELPVQSQLGGGQQSILEVISISESGLLENVNETKTTVAIEIEPSEVAGTTNLPQTQLDEANSEQLAEINENSTSACDFNSADLLTLYPANDDMQKNRDGTNLPNLSSDASNTNTDNSQSEATEQCNANTESASDQHADRLFPSADCQSPNAKAESTNHQLTPLSDVLSDGEIPLTGAGSQSEAIVGDDVQLCSPPEQIESANDFAMVQEGPISDATTSDEQQELNANESKLSTDDIVDVPSAMPDQPATVPSCSEPSDAEQQVDLHENTKQMTSQPELNADKVPVHAVDSAIVTTPEADSNLASNSTQIEPQTEPHQVDSTAHLTEMLSEQVISSHTETWTATSEDTVLHSPLSTTNDHEAANVVQQSEQHPDSEGDIAEFQLTDADSAPLLSSLERNEVDQKVETELTDVAAKLTMFIEESRVVRMAEEDGLVTALPPDDSSADRESEFELADSIQKSPAELAPSNVSEMPVQPIEIELPTATQTKDAAFIEQPIDAAPQNDSPDSNVECVPSSDSAVEFSQITSMNLTETTSIDKQTLSANEPLVSDSFAIGETTDSSDLAYHPELILDTSTPPPSDFDSPINDQELDNLEQRVTQIEQQMESIIDRALLVHSAGATESESRVVDGDAEEILNLSELGTDDDGADLCALEGKSIQWPVLQQEEDENVGRQAADDNLHAETEDAPSGSPDDWEKSNQSAVGGEECADKIHKQTDSVIGSDTSEPIEVTTGELGSDIGTNVLVCDDDSSNQTNEDTSEIVVATENVEIFDSEQCTMAKLSDNSSHTVNTNTIAASGELQQPELAVNVEQNKPISLIFEDSEDRIDKPAGSKVSESTKRKRVEFQVPECLVIREKKTKRHRKKHKARQSAAAFDDELSQPSPPVENASREPTDLKMHSPLDEQSNQPQLVSNVPASRNEEEYFDLNAADTQPPTAMQPDIENAHLMSPVETAKFLPSEMGQSDTLEKSTDSSIEKPLDDAQSTAAMAQLADQQDNIHSIAQHTEAASDNEIISPALDSAENAFHEPANTEFDQLQSPNIAQLQPSDSNIEIKSSEMLIEIDKSESPSAVAADFESSELSNLAETGIHSLENELHETPVDTDTETKPINAIERQPDDIDTESAVIHNDESANGISTADSGAPAVYDNASTSAVLGETKEGEPSQRSDDENAELQKEDKMAAASELQIASTDGGDHSAMDLETVTCDDDAILDYIESRIESLESRVGDLVSWYREFCSMSIRSRQDDDSKEEAENRWRVTRSTSGEFTKQAETEQVTASPAAADSSVCLTGQVDRDTASLHEGDDPKVLYRLNDTADGGNAKIAKTVQTDPLRVGGAGAESAVDLSAATVGVDHCDIDSHFGESQQPSEQVPILDCQQQQQQLHQNPPEIALIDQKITAELDQLGEPSPPPADNADHQPPSAWRSLLRTLGRIARYSVPFYFFPLSLLLILLIFPQTEQDFNCLVQFNEYKARIQKTFPNGPPPV